ncbi:MAG: helix-turn-helix domain-containing protein [Planctomycetia bacterium]|jgi:excisionase family DNA binding protein
MSPQSPREILTIDEAAELLGVSVKTFIKVLHSEDVPARKIGREWKFSRAALVAWVGSGRSSRFYDGAEAVDGIAEGQVEIVPAPRGGNHASAAQPAERSRRTVGWSIDD